MRRPQRVTQINWNLVIPVICGALLSTAAGMLICAAVATVAADGQTLTFLVPAALVGPAALLGLRRGRQLGAQPLIRARDGFLAVTLSWLLAACVGAAPFLLAGTFSSPIAAYFEAMSGFTSTGATLIDVVEQQPKSVLLWRSITQYLGGVGIVVLVVAIAPAAGMAAQRVFYAEISGVADRFTPRIAETAKIILALYATLTVAGFFAFWAAGMSAWDAVNHIFTTVSTGGFSTWTTSIGHFDSVVIELAVIAFMAASGVNFALYWKAMRGHDLRPQIAEVRVYALMLLVGTLLLTASLMLAGHYPWKDSVRYAAFAATALQTGTGFVAADFDVWPHFARAMLLAVMIIGGCAGSTTGGIKVLRAMLLWKTAQQEVSRQLQPKSVQVLRAGGQIYPDDVRRNVLGFIYIFGLVICAGTLALTATGLDLISAFTAALACVTVVGSGLGDVGPTENFAAVSGSGQIILSMLMLIGRLEIFTVLVIFTPLFWRRHGN